MVPIDDKCDAYKKINYYEKYVMDMSKVYYQKIIRDVTAIFAEPKKMLDIGCFDGSLGEVFAKSGWEVHGLEANADACAKAGEKGIRIVKRDMEEGLPYPDNDFDCVIAAEIIEHIYDTDKFLEEVRRVLKPGGILVTTIPNVACLANRIGLLMGKYPRFCEYQAGRSGGHVRVYNKPSIEGQLREHGFKVLKCSGANFPLPIENRFIPAFFKKIAITLGDLTPSIAGQVIITSENVK